ncbi:MAG: hypothetical protein ACE5HO_05465 [bacterium]
MPIFIFIGAILLLFSLMYLFTPKTIVKLSEIGNKLIFTDHGTVIHSKWSGIILLIVSLIMFYIGVTI